MAIVAHGSESHAHERSMSDPQSAPSDQITYATFGSLEETPDASLRVLADLHDADTIKEVDSEESRRNAIHQLMSRAIAMLQRLIRQLFPPLYRSFQPVARHCEPESEAAIAHDNLAKFWTDASGKWWYGGSLQDDDDSQSTTTEVTDLLSESGSFYESPTVSSDLEDGVKRTGKSKTARYQRVASSFPQERRLSVEKYLCKCGKCAQYEIIAQDVRQLVTWRDPQELLSVTRLLQAFSTYNEEIGYRPDMIGTADECLGVWCGDEDHAFTSFVVLQDVVPFLCANTV